MKLQKYRWSRTYESAEEELLGLFERKQIIAERLVAEGGESYEPHTHQLDEKIWCAEGSITITANTTPYVLQAGDALDLPAHTIHSAIAGFAGCAFYISPTTEQNPASPLT